MTSISERKENAEAKRQARLARAGNIGSESIRDFQKGQLEDNDEIQWKRMLRWRNELLTRYQMKSKHNYDLRLAQITALCPHFVEQYWNKILERHHDGK